MRTIFECSFDKASSFECDISVTKVCPVNSVQHCMPEEGSLRPFLRCGFTHSKIVPIIHSQVSMSNISRLFVVGLFSILRLAIHWCDVSSIQLGNYISSDVSIMSITKWFEHFTKCYNFIAKWASMNTSANQTEPKLPSAFWLAALTLPKGKASFYSHCW